MQLLVRAEAQALLHSSENQRSTAKKHDSERQAQRRRTKKFVADMMSGQAMKAFRNWRKFDARRVLIRGALQIQRISCDRLARRRMSLRRTRLTFIAVVCQGFFWTQRSWKAIVARQ